MKNIEEVSKTKFVTALKELREEKGLSQKQVAELLRLPISTYANWEQGRREPSITDIFRLLQVFDATANELFPQN